MKTNTFHSKILVNQNTKRTLWYEIMEEAKNYTRY